VVFIDGLSVQQREDERDRRTDRKLQSVRHLLGEGTEGDPDPEVPLIPPSIAPIARRILTAHGVPVHQVEVGEADPHMAAHFQKEGFAIVSRDSDFFSYDVDFIPWELFQVTDGGVSGHRFNPAHRRAHFGFVHRWPSHVLPLLLGNDTIDSWSELSDLQRELVGTYLPGRQCCTPNILKAAVAFLRDHEDDEAGLEASLLELLPQDVVVRILHHAKMHGAPGGAAPSPLSFRGLTLTAGHQAALRARFRDGTASGHLMTILSDRIYRAGLHIEPAGGLFAAASWPDNNAYVRLCGSRRRLYGLIFEDQEAPVREYLRAGPHLAPSEVTPDRLEGAPPGDRLATLPPPDQRALLCRLLGLDNDLATCIEEWLDPNDPCGGRLPTGAVSLVLALRRFVCDYPDAVECGLPILRAYVAGLTNPTPVLLPSDHRPVCCDPVAGPSPDTTADHPRPPKRPRPMAEASLHHHGPTVHSLPSVLWVYVQHVQMFNALLGLPLPAAPPIFDAGAYLQVLGAPADESPIAGEWADRFAALAGACGLSDALSSMSPCRRTATATPQHPLGHPPPLPTSPATESPPLHTHNS